MKTFEETISDHLSRIGGEVSHDVTKIKNGVRVTLSVDKRTYEVSKVYGDNDVRTYSPRLIRTQVEHLYKCLIQKVLDRNLGAGGAMHVR